MNNKISFIREEERKYHENLYIENRLFEVGTWLHKPVKTVLDTLNYFSSYEYLEVLDLGCGIGRNSIPIAETLKERSGKVVCVDILQSALEILKGYSNEYDVSKYIELTHSDIGDFKIVKEQFDYIVAVSAIEHVESEDKLTEVLTRMIEGTKPNGINCIIMNTNIEEIDIMTGENLEVLMELNLSTDRLQDYLIDFYKGWKILLTTVKPLQFNIERNGKNILLKADCLTYVVQRLL